MLHMFNSNAYSDFRTGYKQVMIFDLSDLTEPKCHKTKQLIVWLKQANTNIWNWAFETIFFDTKRIKSPRQIYVERTL